MLILIDATNILMYEYECSCGGFKNNYRKKNGFICHFYKHQSQIKHNVSNIVLVCFKSI